MDNTYDFVPWFGTCSAYHMDAIHMRKMVQQQIPNNVCVHKVILAVDPQNIWIHIFLKCSFRQLQRHWNFSVQELVATNELWNSLRIGRTNNLAALTREMKMPHRVLMQTFGSGVALIEVIEIIDDYIST